MLKAVWKAPLSEEILLEPVSDTLHFTQQHIAVIGAGIAGLSTAGICSTWSSGHSI